VTQATAPMSASGLPERSLGRRITDAIGRSLIGSDRPWDPANRFGLIILCLVMIGAFGIAYPRFLTIDNAFTILLNITAIGIATFGSSMLLISGNVDLSIAGMYGLIAVSTATIVRDTQNPVLGVVFAIAMGAVLGLTNGRLIRALNINPLIVTLGMGAIFKGLGYVVTDAHTVFGFPEAFEAIGRTDVGPIPVPVIIGALVFIVGGYILLRTVVGLRIYAAGGNLASTKLAGVKTELLVVSLYTVNGALIGLVAVLTIARLGSASPSIGTGFELDVLTAAILGGAAFAGGSGHPLGILFGVITIGVIDAGIIFAGVPDFWQQIVKGAVLILALAADQYAIRRRARARPADAVEPMATSMTSTLAELPPDPALNVPGVTRGATLLACNDLKKSYGAVAAVQGISFSVAAGEVVCLVGDNGAGKSTLIKMLSGAIEPDEGSIEVLGETVRFSGPHVARSFGIETAYQDLALCPNLGSVYNLVLGAEPVRIRLGPLSVRDDKKAKRTAHARLEELGIYLTDDERPVRLLSGGQRQSIAIARIAGQGVKVAILDEPTAALGVRQTKNVLELVRGLAKRGTGVIMISHNIDDVFAVADRVVVLRLGRVVHEGPASELTPTALIHLMAGLSATPTVEDTDRAARADGYEAAPAPG
jgi:ribose/xylose/arabinose/galactoside ABC-type transport system permease subunit/ABC-type multidrug transport system ATPase subunit